MTIEITTIANHTAAIESNTKRNIERLDYNVEDVALSSWGSSMMISAHHTAIRALELGAEHGIDGPACDIDVLCREDGTIVSAKMIDGKYGPCWMLAPEAEAEFGRKFIPAAKAKIEDWRDEEGILHNRVIRVPGRIMKGFGLHEEKRIVEASRWLDGTDPGFIGGNIHYFAKPANKDWFYRGGR